MPFPLTCIFPYIAAGVKMSDALTRSRRIGAFLACLGALVLCACSGDGGGIPRDAVAWGNYRIHCARIKQGMYHCAVYREKERRPVLEKTFIDPSLSGMSGPEVVKKMTRFDVGAIYLAGRRKLVACDIPEDARLVQSVDGRVWISCRLVDDKTNVYYCTAYSTRDGSVLSAGPYAVKRYGWDAAAQRMRYTNVTGPAPFLDFVYYGGVSISLKNRTALMPVDWIDFPDGPRAGLRVKYDADGKAVQEEAY